jgi:hypothetical protein
MVANATSKVMNIHVELSAERGKFAEYVKNTVLSGCTAGEVVLRQFIYSLNNSEYLASNDWTIAD